MKNKNNLVGIGFLLLGGLLSAGTAWLFPVCGPLEDGKWMNCHWSGQVTIGIGVVIGVIALVYLALPDRQLRAGLSLALIPVSVLDIAVLNGVIGLCGRAEMQCRAVTRPAVTILDGAVILLSMANAAWIFYAGRKKKPAGR